MSGVWTRDLSLDRPALIQLSYGYNARFYLRDVKFFWTILLSAEDYSGTQISSASSTRDLGTRPWKEGNVVRRWSQYVWRFPVLCKTKIVGDSMSTVPYFHVRSSCSSSYYKWGRVILVSIVPRSWTLGSIVSGSVRNRGRGGRGGGGDISSLCFRAPLSTLYTLTPSPLLPLKPKWPLVLDNVTGKLRAINSLIKSSRESMG